jgi:hypothetical protein
MAKAGRRWSSFVSVPEIISLVVSACGDIPRRCQIGHPIYGSDGSDHEVSASLFLILGSSNPLGYFVSLKKEVLQKSYHRDNWLVAAKRS